jgi:peptide/nickel transport system substrate-binding protein
MLRGFRWQFLAFVLALVLFLASLIVRSQTSTPPPLPTAPVVTPTLEQPTSAPVALNVSPQPTLPADSATISVAYQEGLVGRVSRLNPLYADLNPVDHDITSLIFEGLTRTNAYGEPEPALASRWTISSDGLEYVFTLRQDVLWQDGILFTSADVAYTMGILRSPDFTGASELASFWRTIETEILGEHLVRFRLTQPLGNFLEQLTIGLLPEHALRGTTAAQLAAHPFNLSPIGTGAYQLEALFADAGGTMREVHLRAAPVFTQRPEAANRYALERIQFSLYDTFDAAASALQNGDLNGLAGRDQSERLRLFEWVNSSDTLTLYTQIDPTLGILIYNWAGEEHRMFRDQRVRVALQSGLNRTSLIDRNLPNVAVPANSPLMPGAWAYLANLAWGAYDPEAARTQLSSAVLPTAAIPAPDVTPTPDTQATMTILTPDVASLVSLTQEVASQWAQLGFDVTVQALEASAYRESLEAGDFDIALVEYSLGNSADPDVYQFWHQGQTPPTGLNYGSMDDRRISELLERARREASGINRIELYHQFQQQFAERAVAIPLYYDLYSYAVSANIQALQLGFIGTPSDRFRNIGDWQIASG